MKGCGVGFRYWEFLTVYLLVSLEGGGVNWLHAVESYVAFVALSVAGYLRHIECKGVEACCQVSLFVSGNRG